MKKQRLIPIIILFVMILNCLLPVVPIQAASNDSIYFNNELYEALKKELKSLNIASFSDSLCRITISEENRAKITSLDLRNSEISDLTGLESFSNLKELNLSGNKLTSESNLEVLNNFQLERLDLSTNNIKDISMINDWEKFAYESNKEFVIQSQEINEVVVLDRDAISNLEEGKIYLPQILDLIEDFAEFNYNHQEQYREDAITVVALTDNTSFGKLEIQGNVPHSINVSLTNESGSINSGIIDLSVNVKAGALIDTEINLSYVVINEEERAAVFKDNNLYTTVKEQLTKDQKINDELRTYNGGENLYKRPKDIVSELLYNKAKVLVFDIDTLINDIPSLKVSGKEISDITGIEAFVGLETKLDLSNDYIDSIEKLIELQDNKNKETELLQERFRKQKDDIAKVREEVIALKTELEVLKKEIEKEEANLEKATSEEEKTKIQNKLNGYTDDNGKNVVGLYEQFANKINKTATKVEKLRNELEELYKIYRRYYRTTTLLTEKITQVDELDELENLEEALSEQLSKIEYLENSQALSEFEKELLINEFSLPTKDDNGNEIEKPIAIGLYSKIAEEEILTKSYCKTMLEKFIEIDVEVQLYYNFPSIYLNGSYGTKLFNDSNIKQANNIAKDRLKNEAFEYITRVIDETSNAIVNDKQKSAVNWINVNGIYTISEETVWKDDTVGYLDNKDNINRIKAEINAEISKIEKNPGMEINETNVPLFYKISEEIEKLWEEDKKNASASDYALISKYTEEEKSERYADTAMSNVILETLKKEIESGYKYNSTELIEMKQIPTAKGSTNMENSKTVSQLLGVSGKITNLTEEEIEAWVEVPKLKDINMATNRLTNIEEIECIKGLEILNVSDNEISDISKVKWDEIVRLKELNLSNNAISDISMLSVIKKLENLNVSKNKLSGIFNLDVQKLKRLKQADFSENAYSSLRNLFINYQMEADKQDIYKYVYENVIIAKGLDFSKQSIRVNLGKISKGQDYYATIAPIFMEAKRMHPGYIGFEYIGSFEGKITADGKAVLVTDELGKHNAIISTTNLTNNATYKDNLLNINYTVTYEVVEGYVKDVDVSIKGNRGYAIIDGKTEFAATIEADANVTDVSINWSIEGNTSTDTEIDKNGVLIVGPDEQAEKIKVIATSNYDTSKSSEITVEVKKADVKLEITSLKNKDGIKTETSKEYKATLETEANNKGIIWSVKGNTSENTTIDQEGVLRVAKDEAAGREITIVATSDYNNEVVDEIKEKIINDEYSGEKDPSTPGDTTKPENPGDTTKPENPEDTTQGKIKIKYDTKDEMVYVEKPNTTIAEFVKGLVDGEHTITVSDGEGNKITDYTKVITTGMVVAIDDSIEDTYEIIVTGDINGDGKVDSIDSNLVKAHRVETKKLEGANFEAADINKDGKVNKIDSFLLLYYRADKIQDFSKETIEKVMK